MQRKTSRADSCISQNSLLPLPVPLSHLCELLVQSEMLMTLIISFNSKQFISHIFQVVLNLLPWVCLARFHRATVLTMFVLLLRFVLQSRKACLLEFSQVYLQCNHALHASTSCLLLTAVSRSTMSNQGFGLLMSLSAWGKKMSLQDVLMAIQSLFSSLPSGC